MTWIKLEDEVADHPKIAGLSDRAFRWWIRSLCYCSRFLTDGLIPAIFLVGVKPNIRKELIAARLWIEADSRLEIHDYLRYQTSRNDVEKERERNRNRRNAGGRTAGTTVGTTAGLTAGVTGEKPPPESRDREQIQIQNTDKSEGRARIQGVGAFEPNSLPRDHMRHAVCGPSMRFCLKSWEFDALARLLNAPDYAVTRTTIERFVAQIESTGQVIGLFSDVEKAFMAWLRSIGKVPAEPAKPKHRGVAEIIAEREAKKAGRAS